MVSCVISLGGSLLYENRKLNKVYLRAIAKLLSKQKRIAVVVGGGSKAREAAATVLSETMNEFLADEAAIRVTRRNAVLVAKAIGGKAVFAKNFEEAARAFGRGRIPVMGGIMAGITTDAVAVLLAERIGAKKLINLSNADGVYDGDPRKNPRAKRLARLTHRELIQLACGSDERKAGTNFVFDLVACKLAARSKITLKFVNGRDLPLVERVLNGKPKAGTVVR